MYMLDTNICIYVIKKRPVSCLEKFNAVENNGLCISAITYGELMCGIEQSLAKKKNERIVADFTSRLIVLSWDMKAARQYGKIRSVLKKERTAMGNMDMLIAAHAMSCNCTLITNNIRDFCHVKNLKYENWV